MWVCPEHGRIQHVEHGNRCSLCGLTALDSADPTNRDALDYARVAASSRTWREGATVVLAIAVMTLLLVGPHAGKEVPWWVVVLVGAIAIVTLGMVAWSSFEDDSWREPGHGVRTLTSTMTLALVINLAFVAVENRLGIESLWYAAGEPPWRLLTATFTHASPGHLIGNLVGAMLFGFVVDRRVGRAWMAVILAVTAVTAALPQALLDPDPMVGFSGCVYGLFGAALALMPTRPMMFRVQTVAIPLPMWVWMIVVVVAFTVVDALDPSRRVAWVAHLGGFFGGVLVALPMRALRPSREFVDGEARRAALVASAVRADGLGDMVPGTEQAEAASSNPAIAAFHRSARRRRTLVTLIGGGFLLVAGATIAILAASMEAPPAAAGRRINVIIASLVMAMLGLAMIGSQLARKQR